MKTIIVTGFLALATMFSSGVAHAVCYQDCYQNGNTYQCTTNCY